MYLLDTNVVSELRKNEKANLSVQSWIKNIPVQSTYLSVITIMELRIGILRKARHDAIQAAMFSSWMNNQVLVVFKNRILPITLSIAERCAGLHVPDPRSEYDAFIAATALEYNLIVVTRNVKDFQTTGVQLLNPWECSRGE